jgi:hypothetical protein
MGAILRAALAGSWDGGLVRRTEKLDFRNPDFGRCASSLVKYFTKSLHHFLRFHNLPLHSKSKVRAAEHLNF